MSRYIRNLAVLFLIIFVMVSCSHSPEDTAPEAVIPGISGPAIEGTWPAWESAAAAGWSESELREAWDYFRSLASAAVVVVYRGKVLFAWGLYKVNFLTHSTRKSFMSAIYGIYVDRGQIDLDKTMEELGIDDEPPLTDAEKQAKVIHLLQARSGVYHTAAAETQSMHDYKPDRGTYGPGEFWCYNNWDFNVLATIFDQETDTDFWSALSEDLNAKLGMEDYNAAENRYSYQLDRSVHPAYGFKISARDCARFGQLYLQKGRWGEEQIISRTWVEESTAMVSDSGAYIAGTWYGYMWWIYPEGFGEAAGLDYLSRFRSFAALGAYGQVIQVVPDMDLVFVHRVNSFNNNNVPLDRIYRLLDMILDAGI